MTIIWKTWRTPWRGRGSSVWTPLRRNSTYALCVAKSLSSLTSFCSSYYLPANDCWLTCVSSHILVLLFPPGLPSILSTSQMFSAALPLPKFFWAFPFEVPLPAYFPTSFYPFLLCTLFPPALSSRTFLSYFRSQNPLEHARSGSFLQRASFPYVLSCTVNFTLLSAILWLQCVFSSSFVFLEFSWISL